MKIEGDENYVIRGFVSKETMVLRRQGSTNECLVLSKKFITKFGNRKEIRVLANTLETPYKTKE